MSKNPAVQSSSPSRHQARRYRTLLFGACLVISVAIHIATVVALLLPKTDSSLPAMAGFIEMKDFTASRPPSSPEIRMPAPPMEQHDQLQTHAAEGGRNETRQGDPQAAANPYADILATSLGRGMANGFFSTLGDGRTLRDDIRGYYFELLERINERWWQKAATLNDSARRDGIAEVLIGRDGTLYGVRLLNDTGSQEVNRAIIDVLSGSSPFAPLPASYETDLFRAPLRFTAPSNLFRANSGR